MPKGQMVRQEPVAAEPTTKQHPAQPARAASGHVNDVLFLQRTIGNRAVQRLLASSAQPRPASVQQAAARGVQTPATQLPFLDRLQPVFGRHDLGQVQAHVGPEAAASAEAMNAWAYTTGGHVVFSGSPDLWTAAHEAAHVVQQRGGVQLPSGVGSAGDAYETHADAVAERAVRDESAEALLDTVAPSTSGAAAHPAVQRIARNALVPDTDYHAIIDGAHRQARFLGTDQRGAITEYWFQEGEGRFYLRSDDFYSIYTNEEWAQARPILEHANDKVRAQAGKAADAGATAPELDWARQNAASNANLYYLLAAIAVWRPRAGDIQLVRDIVQANIAGKPLYELINAARSLVVVGKATPAEVLFIFTRYLTGAQRGPLVLQFLQNIDRLSMAQANTFIGLRAGWLVNLLQLDNLLQLVLAVPGVDRGLAALTHAVWIYARAQTLLEMLAHAPNADFNTLEWVASANRPSGNTPQERAASGEFIHTYRATQTWVDVAKWIVRDLAQTGAHRVAVHDYVTNNGAINDQATLHQRYVAIRATNGVQAAATLGLAANYQLIDATNILVASQVPRKHIANSDRDAYDKAKFRDEGTTANSSTMTGAATFAQELLRVMQHHRAEIFNLANGGVSRLMELDVAVHENIWFRNGPARTEPARVPWASLEVVIAKDGRGNLVLVHAQPNARAAVL